MLCVREVGSAGRTMTTGPNKRGKLTKEEISTAKAYLLSAALRGKPWVNVRVNGAFVALYRRKGHRTGKWYWASYVDCVESGHEVEAFADMFYIDTHKKDGEARALALALRAGEREIETIRSPQLKLRRLKINKFQDLTGGFVDGIPHRRLWVRGKCLAEVMKATEKQ
jgi:hypothetical protein